MYCLQFDFYWTYWTYWITAFAWSQLVVKGEVL